MVDAWVGEKKTAKGHVETASLAAVGGGRKEGAVCQVQCPGRRGAHRGWHQAGGA